MFALSLKNKRHTCTNKKSVDHSITDPESLIIASLLIASLLTASPIQNR